MIQPVSKYVHKISSDVGDFLDDEEIAVLHKIQKKYIQLKSRRLNTISSATVHAQKLLKEAKTPKKASKSPAKTPRKTPRKKKSSFGSGGKRTPGKTPRSKKAAKKTPKKAVTRPSKGLQFLQDKIDHQT